MSIYELQDIFSKIEKSLLPAIVEEDDFEINEVCVPVEYSQFDFSDMSFQEILSFFLRKIDKRYWLGKNRKEIIKIIKMKHENEYRLNSFVFSWKDMILTKDLRGVDFKGIDLSDVCFDDVNIAFSKFKGTNAKINLQTVKGKDLSWCDLEGLGLSQADFSGVCISKTNLKDTGAKIDLKNIFGLCGLAFQLKSTCLSGCYVLNNIDFEKDGICLEDLGNPILVDSFEEIKEMEEREKEEVMKLEKICNKKSFFRYNFSNNDYEHEKILIHGLPVYLDDLSPILNTGDVVENSKRLIKK